MSELRQDGSEALNKRLRPSERVKWVYRKDMRAELLATLASLPFLVMFTPFIAVPAAMAGMFLGGPSTAFLLGGLAMIGVPLVMVLVGVLNVTLGDVEYAATSERFVKVRDTVTKSEEESVPLNRVRDAEYSEGALDKLFGTGDIRIEGAKGDTLEFNDIPEGDDVLRNVRQEIGRTKTVDDRHA